MPLFSQEQIDEIRRIIEAHHTGFAIAVFGRQVSPALRAELEARHLIPADAPRLIDDAYVYAQLLARSGDYNLMTATPETVIARLRINPQPPHTPVEKATIETARRHAGEYCRGLEARVATDIVTQIQAAEDDLTPDEIKDIIKEETAENRERRETAANLKSNLGHRVKNWTRDWLRIATSESNDAIQEGLAATLERDHGDPNVSKIVRPDCCSDCRRLYVEAATGEPKVFKLSTLRANGTNVGRKPSEWKAVVGNTHPWCACNLVIVPAGMAWKDGELIFGKATLSKSRRLHDRYMFQGMPISIETMEGTPRFWGDPSNGESGITWAQSDYGYIRETEGADGEHIDCYVLDDEDATHVHVIHQRKKLGKDRFEGHDEDKIILGARSAAEAKRFYLEHYNDPRFFGSMTSIPVEKFKKILAKNKGKRLCKIEVLDTGPLEKGYVDRTSFFDLHMQSPLTKPRMMNIVQGADDVPKPGHTAGVAQIAEDMGLTAKGRRKRKREKDKYRQIQADAVERARNAWFNGPILGIPRASVSPEWRRNRPEMLGEFREQAAHDGAERGKAKREKAEEISARRRGTRTSDITPQLTIARLHKSEPRLVVRLPRADPAVFARAKVDG